MKLLLTSIWRKGNVRMGIIRQVGSNFLSGFGVVAHLLNISAVNSGKIMSKLGLWIGINTATTWSFNLLSSEVRGTAAWALSVKWGKLFCRVLVLSPIFSTVRRESSLKTRIMNRHKHGSDMKLLLTSIGKTGNGRMGIIRQVGSNFLSGFGVVAHLLNISAVKSGKIM